MTRSIWHWLALATRLALAGCSRGGVMLTGDKAVAAPELPTDDAVWMNGKIDLAALHGQVLLIEAWSPS
jgi:hypothetical protein